MALVRDWRRQTARAAAASLIFPVALFAVAALVAAGGGLGGLGSLGQLTSGPQLPATNAPAPSRSSSVETAGIVAVDPSLSTGTSGGRDAATRGGGGGTSPADGGSPNTTPGGRAPTPTPAPGGGPAPVAPVRGGTPTAPSPGTGGGNPGVVPKAPSPVQQIIDDDRGVGESLPGPLGPTTGPSFDSLLGNTSP